MDLASREVGKGHAAADLDARYTRRNGEPPRGASIPPPGRVRVLGVPSGKNRAASKIEGPRARGEIDSREASQRRAVGGGVGQRQLRSPIGRRRQRRDRG